MSSKRKTPARRKSTPASSQLSAPAEQSAVQAESPVSAPVLTEVAPALPASAPAPVAATEVARVQAPRVATLSTRMSHEERHRMIAKVAYGYAEKAGFRGNPVEDWLMAEREVDARLSRLAS